jgi:hypothetical protein
VTPGDVVLFTGDLSVRGRLVEPPPWDRDGWPHVRWDGDDYVCVLRPDEVTPARRRPRLRRR